MHAAAEPARRRAEPGRGPPTAAAATGDGALILIAEDHDVNRILMERLLDERGHRDVAADNGLEAVQLGRAADVDLVFMDCQMPELDGYAATRESARDERRGAPRCRSSR